MIARAYKVLHDKEWALYNYDHMADCSCPMCGNIRNNKWLKSRYKLTMQELKANDDYKDQLNATTR